MIRRRGKRLRRRGTKGAVRAYGFTLIELIVSITVGVIISGSAGLLILNAARQRAEVSARSELIDMGSAAMECVLRYVREIRQDENFPAGPTPDLQGNAQISTASATELRFDNYGIRLNGSEIQITNDTGGNWHTFAKNVTGLTFTYYGWTSGIEAPQELSPLPLSSTNRQAVRIIQIQIDLARGSETTRLRTSVYLRSFMNEVNNAP
ncbi:MAG: type II secretion system GspH family protein [Phycisphaerales bacterium]|nr:type II secretion system GspH family protein [Phycisphaerales bacterium]